MKIQLFHEAGHSGQVLQVARLPSPSDTAVSPARQGAPGSQK